MALTGATPAWAGYCVVVGAADVSEITGAGTSVVSVPVDVMSQLTDCSRAKVQTGNVCLMTETSCEPRPAGMELVGKDGGAADGPFKIVAVLLNGYNVTSQGLTRSHQDSASLAGFPYSKVLAPADGKLVIPLGPAGGSATNFSLMQDGRPITRVASATGTIVLDASRLERETAYTWSVTAGGRPYSGQFYVMSDEKSQAARTAVENTVAAAGNVPPGAQRVLRAIALQKRGLTLDATVTLVTAGP
jgi:hypothetical protein